MSSFSQATKREQLPCVQFTAYIKRISRSDQRVSCKDTSEETVEDSFVASRKLHRGSKLL